MKNELSKDNEAHTLYSEQTTVDLTAFGVLVDSEFALAQACTEIDDKSGAYEHYLRAAGAAEAGYSTAFKKRTTSSSRLFMGKYAEAAVLAYLQAGWKSTAVSLGIYVTSQHRNLPEVNKQRILENLNLNHK